MESEKKFDNYSTVLKYLEIENVFLRNINILYGLLDINWTNEMYEAISTGQMIWLTEKALKRALKSPTIKLREVRYFTHPMHDTAAPICTLENQSAVSRLKFVVIQFSEKYVEKSALTIDNWFD